MGLAVASGTSPRVMARWRLGDFHQFTGILALGLVAAHVCVLVAVKDKPFSVPELLVPFTRTINPLPPLFGVTALYVVVLVAAISHARRHIGLHMWRVIHAFSFVGFALAVAHAVAAGPDTSEPAIRILYGVTLLALVALSLVRIRRRVHVSLHRRSRVDVC